MKKKYTFLKARVRNFIIAILILVSFQTSSQSLQFYQLSFDYGGPFTSDSDWGAADLTFTGDSAIFYFNLTVDTTWAIENMPVLSTKGAGILQTQRFWFRIGNTGIPITSISYGFSFLTDTVASRPILNNTATVSSDVVIIHSGAAGNPGTGAPPPYADKQKGGKIVASAVPTNHSDFPSQECGVNECVPAAISNSLQWLNIKNNLGMDPNSISIAALCVGLDKGATGVDKDKIVDKKTAYCLKNKLPVTTQKVRSQAFGEIINEIDHSQDVELILKKLDGGYHAVAITGIAKTGTGKFAITITEDSKQGCTGGTVSEPATYDRTIQKWGEALVYASGAPDDFYFIVECPVKKIIESTKNVPGGSNHKLVPGRASEFGGNHYQIRNLELAGYNNNTPPPALGNAINFTFTGIANIELSIDSGITFLTYTAPYTANMNVKHIQDTLSTEYYNTEMLSMTLSGGSLPSNIHLRESPAPADSSNGLMAIKPLAPGQFETFHYMDIIFELSTDGGSNWVPADNKTCVLYMDDSPVSTDVSSLPERTNIKVTNTLFSSQGSHTITFVGLDEGSILIVYNMMGQMVYYSDNYKNDFSVYDLPAGMYLYKLQLQNHELSTGKVVVAK